MSLRSLTIVVANTVIVIVTFLIFLLVWPVVSASALPSHIVRMRRRSNSEHRLEVTVA